MWDVLFLWEVTGYCLGTIDRVVAKISELKWLMVPEEIFIREVRLVLNLQS